MTIPVTITAGTPFDENLGDSALLTISFITDDDITYKTGTPLYFYAVISEGTISETVCFKLSGGDNPLLEGTTSFVIENSMDFTDSATATGKIYYTAAA